MHQTIFAVDVEGFGARSAWHQERIRQGLISSIREAFGRCGLPWEDSHVEDRGDGLLVFLPPDTQKRRLVEDLPNELAGRLREHNAGAADGARIRLRMVLHAGEVVRDEQGVSSSAVVVAFRLLNAAALKAALAESRGVLALITSTVFFHDVVTTYPAANPDIYWQARVCEKETDTTAWICLPDNYLLPGGGDDPPRVVISASEVKRRRPILERVAGRGLRTLPRSARSAVDLVGRHEELAQLLRMVESSARGHGAAVVVGGEPGIGKTSLLDRVAAECQRLGMRVMRGTAEELEERIPFAAIGSCLGISGTTTDEAARQISELMRGEGALGVTGRSDAASRESLIIEAILSLMDDWCAGGAVALFLDDLQWADAASLRVLNRLGRVIGQLPLFVGTSCLPTPRSDKLAALLRGLDMDEALSVSLGPLPDPAVGELVERLVGARPGPDLLAMVGQAAGNPLYITELVTALAREQRIRVVDGTAALTTWDNAAVPASLADMIRHHTGFLSAHAQRILPIAAALGTGFSVTELAMVLNEPLSSLLGIIREAIQVGLLVDAADDLVFRHDLIRRVLADSLPESAHIAIHAQTGHALAAAHARAERVAEHLLQGAVMDAAALDWLAGSAEALAVRAPALAVDLLRHALSLADPRDRRREALRFQLCRALQWAGQSVEAEEAIGDALVHDPDPAQENVLRWLLALACFAQGKLDDVVRECESALATGQLTAAETARFQGLIAQRHFMLSNFDDTMAMAEQARQTAVAGKVEWSAVNAIDVMSAVYSAQQRSEQALRAAEEELSILATYEGKHPDLPFGIAPYMLKGWSLTELDRPIEAGEAIEAGMRFCERTGSPLVAMHHATKATLRFLQGRWDDALAEIRAGQDIPDPMMVAAVPLNGLAAIIGIHRNDRAVISATSAWPDDVPPAMAFTVFWHKWPFALAVEAEGDPERAFDLLFTYWEQGSPLPRGHMHHLCPDLARLAITLDKRHLASRVADELATLAARETKSAAIQGTAALCRGLAEGNVDLLRVAVAAYQRAGRPLYQAHAYENAAVLLAKCRRGSQALAALDTALDLYAGLDAIWDAGRAGQRIHQAGVHGGVTGPRHRSKTGWDALTPTERKVTALVAEGHSNPAIATRMLLSRRTVQCHVSSILSKLGLTSRVELAAIATTHENTDLRGLGFNHMDSIFLTPMGREKHHGAVSMMMPDSITRLDQNTPALARVYDYVLGGGYNFEADRRVAEQILDLVPAYRDFALENRAFLRRAALHMLAAGIDQFLDLGSGLLSVGPSHEIVQEVDPECRVVYVDNDPIVIAHVALTVGDDPRVGVVLADMSNAHAVLGHPTTLRVLDLDRPVGVFAIAVLHCIPDTNNPTRALAEYHDGLAPGSMLAATHAHAEGVRPERAAAGMKVLIDAGLTYVRRTRKEFATMLGPWRPTPEGVVLTSLWRPDDTSSPRTNVLGYAVMTTSTR